MLRLEINRGEAGEEGDVTGDFAFFFLGVEFEDASALGNASVHKNSVDVLTHCLYV